MFVADSRGSAYGGSSTAAGGKGGAFRMPGPWDFVKAGGKGAAAIGSILAGNAAASGLRKQAKAKLREAISVREAGTFEQIRMNEEGRRVLSTQRELFGQAGVTVDGAPANLMRATNETAVLDRMTLAKNVQNQYYALVAEAKDLRKAARRTKRAGQIGAFSEAFG